MIFEKIRERLQEKKQSIEQNMFGNEDDMVYLSEAINIINQVEAEYNNDMVYQLAMKYALCLTQYGVNITEKLETATQNAMALEQAYIRGRQDECDRFSEWRDRHNNGWISVDDRLPEPNKVCLVAYKVSGVMRIAIFLFNGIDFNQTEGIEVIYWQPLPQPPKGE